MVIQLNMQSLGSARCCYFNNSNTRWCWSFLTLLTQSPSPGLMFARLLSSSRLVRPEMKMWVVSSGNEVCLECRCALVLLLHVSWLSKKSLDASRGKSSSWYWLFYYVCIESLCISIKNKLGNMSSLTNGAEAKNMHRHYLSQYYNTTFSTHFCLTYLCAII